MKRYLLISFLFVFSHLAQAQLIDYLQFYVGTKILPSSEQLNPLTKLPENIYGEYIPAQTLGVTAMRQITDHTSIGAGYEIANTVKSNYNLNMNTISTYVKYNFNNIESFISPYVIGGANLAFVSIRQKAFQEEVNPDQSGLDPKFAPFEKIRYREQYVNLLFVPVPGVHGGGGLEFKIREGWGINFQYLFNYEFTQSSPLLKKTYNYNKANLSNHTITVGLRLFL